MEQTLHITVPLLKYSKKPFYIYDGHTCVGSVKKLPIQGRFRFFIHFLNLFMSRAGFEKINIIGLTEKEETFIKVTEQSFRDNLYKMKWNISLNHHDENFLLRDNTKISTHVSMTYEKKEDEFIFQRTGVGSTYEVIHKERNEVIAIIKPYHLLSRKVGIDLKSDDLHLLELVSIYYTIRLTY
ncbi:hypothetical protein ACERII_05920 [Evansella sp. AB-rgal1]|uniref:tubby C-terminal domain-like protein n=1 Tax=Evansella sp. AB-rgal1 TaxID=3242696 RepID=UPI00359E2C2E